MVGKEQVGDQRHVDLGEHGVSGVSDERLDLEVLLDEPEEDLDLPAILVDVGDGAGREGHVVCQELERLSGFLVPIPDAPKQGGLVPTAYLNDLVGGDAGEGIHGIALKDFELGVALESGDDEHVVLTEFPEPSVVGVASVGDQDGTLGQFEESSHLDLMTFGIRDGDHRGEIAVMVVESVEFDSSLGIAELGPGEQRQAEVNDRGVKALQLVIK